MRHRREVPNGLMGYLFSGTMLRLHAEGYQWFGLGLAPLAGVGDAPGVSVTERVAHEIYEHASRIFSFKELRSFKARFDPSREERFSIYQGGSVGLLRTALALACLARGYLVLAERVASTRSTASRSSTDTWTAR